jgi:hypothetical protein
LAQIKIFTTFKDYKPEGRKQVASEQTILTDNGVLLRVEAIGGARPLTQAMLTMAFAEALARLFPETQTAEEPDNRGGRQETGVMTQPGREVKSSGADRDPTVLAKNWADAEFSTACRILGRAKTTDRLRRSPRL